MARKRKKTKEEKVAEEFFPVDEDDLKNTVEKEVKENPLAKEVKETVEIPETKTETIPKTTVEKEYIKKEPEVIIEKTGKQKKSKKKKTKRKTQLDKVLEYKPKNIKLKENGYELIITEKPQAASKIANALGNPKKIIEKGVSYYKINKEGKEIVIACAVGHLLTLKQAENKKELPVFEVKWVPNFLVNKKDFTKKYYDLILKLAKNAGKIIIATDYDIEGEVIGLNVLRFICNQQDGMRMKFSALTKEEIIKAYENKTNTINWGQAIAGETRHYVDWYYGINLSRALMEAIKSNNRFKIMSIGRVQGPTLNLIVEKEEEIQKFKPQKYWQVIIEVSDGKNKIELKYNKDIFDKEELKKFEELKGKEIKLKIEEKEESIPPRPPFNLTTLQTEAYRLYGITPAKTLQIAQSLYLAGLISYPRTSSQKIPESVDYKKILKKLAKEYGFENLIKRKKPIEGKKTDPAHPSIYPTGEKQVLSGDEEKIYNLIVKRFLSLFCEDAKILNKKIIAEIENLKFTKKGATILNRAWMNIYPIKLDEEILPEIDKDVRIEKIKTQEKETKPPKRYSPASIVSEMEKRGLGTKATRASIVETLYDRGYIKGTQITATPFGISLIRILKKYSPIIIDEELTRNLEKEMEEIQEAKKELQKKKESILEKTKKIITKIIEDFKTKKQVIGKELLEANQEMAEQERIENTIMRCPKCQKGNLIIRYSKSNKRYFVGCDNYPECTNTYTLPPSSKIIKTDKRCEECGFPLLMSIKKGKKPWIFCFNPECKKNKERIEAYKNTENLKKKED